MLKPPSSTVPLSQYTLIDAHGCDQERLSNLAANEDFAGQLCDALGGKPDGELLIANFGGDPNPDPRIHGPSFAQMLNRGLIQGHCPTHPRLACVDVLQEGDFDPSIVERLTREFYKAQSAQTLTIMRGVPNEKPHVNNVQDTAKPNTRWSQVETPPVNQLTSMSTVQVNSAFAEHAAWGQFTYIDLFDCDPEKINDPHHVATYFKELCVGINAAPYDDPITGDFNGAGDTQGLSFAQLIETSLVQGHFLKDSRRGMIDIFSCRQFHPKMNSDYAAQYFGADSYSTFTILRGCEAQFPVIFHNRLSTRNDLKWILEPTEAGE